MITQKLLSSPWQIKGLLVIGISLGNLGWTIVKVSDNKFFCNRAKNSIHPRLSDLAKYIGFDAFAYKLHDNYWGALLEADSSGQIFVSGYLDNSNSIGEHDFFCCEPIRKTTEGLNFYLLNISEELKAASKKIDISQKEKIKREEKLEEFIEQHPEKINYALSEYRKIHQSGFVQGNENIGRLLCKSSTFWNENNLLYKAYAEPEQLEKDRVKLLFFQVGRLELNPKAEEIWSPITSREDYGKEPWQDIPF